MANISFFQCVIVLILFFLMFGDTQNLKQNFRRAKLFFSKKEEPVSPSKKNQEKRDSNP
jgi:Sec-independent protein translocase protein TatA